MRPLLLFVCAAASGCATTDPLTPEQRAAMIRATQIPPSTYQVVPPMPPATSQLPRPISCTTYRNLAGQVQTDCR